MRKLLVILSGPSAVGKGPLRRALRRLHQEIKFGELVLCTSRRPRKRKDGQLEVHGIDYYFLPKGLLAHLGEGFIVAQVRSDLQAVDVAQCRELFRDYDLILAEVYPSLGRALLDWAAKQPDLDFDVRTVALIPLSSDELMTMAAETERTFSAIVYEVMKQKLENRAEDSPEKIEERAASAFAEMCAMEGYTDPIVCHQGEGSPEWNGELGDEAQSVLQAFLSVLRGEQPQSPPYTIPGNEQAPRIQALEKRLRYRAVLWDYPEGQPGGGGIDSTLSYEQLPKTAWHMARADAEADGTTLNAACGYDFFVRIEAEEI